MAETQENFSEIRANEAAPTDTQQNQVQTREVNPLVRFVSILPCMPKVEPKPPTPNIDEVFSIKYLILFYFFGLLIQIFNLD